MLIQACIHPVIFRGGDDMSERIAQLEESLKKEAEETAKNQEIIRELKLTVSEIAAQRDDLQKQLNGL